MPKNRQKAASIATKLSPPELNMLSEFLKLSSRPTATGPAAEKELLVSLAFVLQRSARSC